MMVGSCLYQVVCLIVASSLLNFVNSQLNETETKKQAFTVVGVGGAIDFSSIMKPGEVDNSGKGKKKKKKGKKNAKNRGQEKKEREAAFKKKVEREKGLLNENGNEEIEKPSTTIVTTVTMTQATFTLGTSLIETKIPETATVQTAKTEIITETTTTIIPETALTSITPQVTQSVSKLNPTTVNMLSETTISSKTTETTLFDTPIATSVPMTTSIITTSILTTSIPTTSIPTKSLPTTSIPTTSIPTTSIPTTSIPSTSIPATSPPESTPQNLPIPKNLRKINATQSSITIRFEIPPESTEIYTHFNIKYQKVTVTDFGTVPAIIGEEKERFNVNRDDIETFKIDGGPLFSERVFEDLTAGRLYEISVQTMKAVKGRKNKDLSDKIIGENLIYVRTLPRQPKDLVISPVNNNPNKIKVFWQNLATSIQGPIYDGVMLRWGEPDSENGIKYPEQKSFMHKPPTIGMSPVGERMSHELENLELGNSFRFQVYSFSGETGEADEKTKSAILTEDYSVGFLGPFDVRKVFATETELGLSFVGQPITGVTKYEIMYQGIFSNGSFTREFNTTVLSKIDYSKIQKETVPVRDDFEPLDEFEQNQFDTDELINRDTRQSIQFSETENDLPREFFNVTDLTPGILYNFEIRAVRNLDMVSKATFNQFRTLPALPTNFTTVEVNNRDIFFDFIPASTGIFTRYEVDQSTFDPNSNTYLNSSIPTKFFDVETKNLTGTGLRPGALYQFNVTVYSEEGSKVDATRQTYSFEERTIPKPPSGATVESTVGSIHLKWRAPTGMAQDSSYQYKISYNIVKPLIDETNIPKDLYKTKTLWSSGSNGATRREDFLTDLKSGRLYEIRIFTVAGSKKDSIRTSEALGPLRTFTQPDYPVFLNTFQVTAKHLKIKWKPPESEGGRFDGYILRINRRREPRATVVFDVENYVFNFEAGINQYVLEATPGAVYKMTLTTMVRFGNEVFESILIAANKLDAVEVWSPYQSHLPFPVQKCENKKFKTEIY